MKALNIITLVLVIVGALNWGLFGLTQIDLVATLFGGPFSMGARVIYVLVGLSGVWQLIPLFGAASSDRVNPQDARSHDNRVH